MDKSESKRDRYLRMWNGKRLLKDWPDLNYEATWCIYGEDKNAELAGPHYEPVLGYYVGPLTKIIDIAVNLPHFWTWGAGGRISCIEIKDVS